MHDPTKPPFNLTTVDPRFDPQEPITVNGYRFVPASKSEEGEGANVS